MSPISIANTEALIENHRFDSEFFDPSYIKLQSQLLRMDNDPLVKCADVTDGNHLSIAKTFQKEGVRYLRGQDLSDLFIEETNPVFISEETYRKLARSHVKLNDVLLSIVGTIGNVAFVYDETERLTANCKLAIIRAKNIEPEYIFAYLASKFGQAQIKRNIRGTVQRGLILPDLKKILIIKTKVEIRKAIASMVIEAHKQKEKSLHLYNDAEILLLDEVGLKSAWSSLKQSYEKTLVNLKKAKRIDAEYFKPDSISSEVMTKIQSYQNGYTCLLDCAEDIKADYNPLEYPDKISNYVELTNIDTSIGVISNPKKTKGEKAPNRARRILKTNDVLVSSVKGSLNKVALVTEEFEGALASNGFFQLRAKKIHPEALLVLAKSNVLRSQLERECTGTILSAVPNDAIKRLIIPILSNDIQVKIKTLIKGCHDARKRAREIVIQAIEKVEKEIES